MTLSCLILMLLLFSNTAADPPYVVAINPNTGKGQTFSNVLAAVAWCRDNTFIAEGGGRLASFADQTQLDAIWDTCRAAYPFGTPCDDATCSSWWCYSGWYNEHLSNTNWNWIFQTGKPIGYSNWSPGQDMNTNQFCGAVSTPHLAVKGYMFSMLCGTGTSGFGAVCEPNICEDFQWDKDCTISGDCCTSACSSPTNGICCINQGDDSFNCVLDDDCCGVAICMNELCISPPTMAPSISPTHPPSISPTQPPSIAPSTSPTNGPSDSSDDIDSSVSGSESDSSDDSNDSSSTDDSNDEEDDSQKSARDETLNSNSGSSRHNAITDAVDQVLAQYDKNGQHIYDLEFDKTTFKNLFAWEVLGIFLVIINIMIIFYCHKINNNDETPANSTIIYDNLP